MNALEIQDLTKHYPGFSLEKLNLTLPWGCIRSKSTRLNPVT